MMTIKINLSRGYKMKKSEINSLLRLEEEAKFRNDERSEDKEIWGGE